MQMENWKDFIELDELSEETFSIEKSVEKAYEVLDSVKENDEAFIGKFEDQIWTFDQRLIKGATNVFDFSKVEVAAIHSDNWDPASIVIIVKCWVAELLGEFYPESVRNKFGLLIKIIEQTNFFSPTKSGDFIEFLQNYSPQVKKVLEKKQFMNMEDLKKQAKRDRQGISTVYEYITTSLNFLTFSELETFHAYHRPLIDMRGKLPGKVFTRQLPSGKDVLKLDHSINRYFEKGLHSPSKVFFAPILLWWRITNIIPVRISEFCTIKRECISQNNERYYITLPREKKRATERSVQVVDTLEITKDIFDLINDYIQLTNPYGESKTLISYKAIAALEAKGYNRLEMKKDPKYFNRLVFSTLLNRFYREVIYVEFNESVKREVRPNDTRHFAFCSLLMQGISPIEIARLGGHSSIEAQYHYSNHTEYFIDIEVKKLMDSFKRKDGELKGTTFDGHEVTFEDIEERSLQFPSKDNETRLQMEIGYCTDELQRCESEECMLCKHWWIHPHKLVEVKPLIQNKILERKQKIIEIGNFLKNLNESLTTEILKQNEVSPNTFVKMKTEATSVQEHLEEIARLEMLKGVNIDE